MNGVKTVTLSRRFAPAMKCLIVFVRTWRISKVDTTIRGLMKACTRCGAWHTDAEHTVGRHMSCTEVKQYWSDLKRKHSDESGHLAMLKLTKDGKVVCIRCDAVLTQP
jgi:hypothetical protein